MSRHILWFSAILLLALASRPASCQEGFRNAQQRYPGVRQAYEKHWEDLVACKQARKLEVWGRNRGEGPMILLRTCGNCASSFHLSLGLDYPNASDRVLSDPNYPGGDIYIHGSCVTIGCIPLTDPRIRELYILCVEARNNGQLRIPVTIYPARMSAPNHRMPTALHRNDPDRLGLWKDLKLHYDAFQDGKVPPQVTFREDGRHRIQ